MRQHYSSIFIHICVVLQSAVYCVRFVLGCFVKKMSDDANLNDSIQIDFEIRTMSGSANNSNDSDVENEMDFECEVGERPGTPEELIEAAADIIKRCTTSTRHGKKRNSRHLTPRELSRHFSVK